MNPPSLSVVLANYNHAEYLGRALEAIVSQSVHGGSGTTSVSFIVGV